MNKNTASDYVTIGVRLPSSVASSFDGFCNAHSLTRSSCLRLLLSWLCSGVARPVRGKFGRFVREYKSYQQI